MMVNRLIDVLTTRPSDQFMFLPKPEKKAYYADLLRKAEKFDFGIIDNVLLPQPIPSGDEERGMRWLVPELTREENDFINAGLVPLPAPLVWYEFELNGYRSGFIIENVSDMGWRITRVDYQRDTGSGVMDGMWIRREGPKHPTAETVMRFIPKSYAEEAELAGPQIGYSKPGDEKRMLIIECDDPKYLDHYTANPFALERDLGIASNWNLSRFLTLMINSKTTTIERVAGATPLARRKVGTLSTTGREPRHEFRRVTIVSREAIRQSIVEGERERMPPRLHWRRSHLRHYAERTAQSVWKGNEVHNGTTGWHVIVIPRQIIGRAELGSISHEYLIKQDGPHA